MSQFFKVYLHVYLFLSIPLYIYTSKSRRLSPFYQFINVSYSSCTYPNVLLVALFYNTIFTSSYGYNFSNFIFNFSTFHSSPIRAYHSSCLSLINLLMLTLAVIVSLSILSHSVSQQF